MIKLSVNVKKIDFTRVRQGNTNKDNEYLTLLVRKTETPDKQGYTHSVIQAQTDEERKSGASKIYVGRGREVDGLITDEDPRKFYMVFVEGGESPKSKHAGIGMATREANRLAKLMGMPTYVLEAVNLVNAGGDEMKEKKPKEKVHLATAVIDVELPVATIIEEEKAPEKKVRVRKPIEKNKVKINL